LKAKILIVEDEKDIQELVSYNLQKEGFDVSASGNGEDALELIKREDFSLLILDLMLPGIQGIELCRMLKSAGETASMPIIMLTAKGEEVDKILGLEMGADDYITKPFSPRELIARVKAVLRRTRGEGTNEQIVKIGDLEINDMLLDAVWKDESYVEPRTVDVHIRRLRTQVEDDPSNPVYIKTRRGIGYYVDGGS
jgi:DNA-binding response OmpR family regulator